MGRAVLVVARYPGQPVRLHSYRDALNRRLAGANIEPRAPVFVRQPQLAVALLNPTGSERVQGASVAIGTLLEAGPDWHVPGAPLPDGSFALLRADAAYVELAADAVGSRTLWYAMTDHELIAATSQRAIVTLLGSFEPSFGALPWMLSAGTLGPTAAWDTRIRRVQPGERVLLDRASWRLSVTTAEIRFGADDSLSRAAHLERLNDAVADACRKWSFDSRRWLLALSGGADSRSLLWLLRGRGIETVTWGLRTAIEQDGNDARVAQTLARRLAVKHRFLALEPRPDAAEIVLDRFLAAGEGRVARISGYVDGFRVWKTLFAEGYHGVIRGDEAFGSIPVSSEYTARWTAALTTLDDYFSPGEVDTFELPRQRLPDSLARRSAETLAMWRDRLYQQSRVPTLLAGLTDLKSAYLEVASPLLANNVLACARALPDELRTKRRLWRELVALQIPSVPFATRVAIPSLTDFLADRRVLELLLADLSSEPAAALFAPLLRTRLLGAVRAALRGRRAPDAERPRRRVPAHANLRAVMRRFRRATTLEPLVLAFRAVVATRMHRLLAVDAATPPAELEPVVNA